MSVVETPRLLLRQPREADAGPFVNIHQDPEVVKKKQVTLTAPLGGVEAGVRNVNRMLRHWEQCGYGQWAVVEKSSGCVIGCVGLFHSEEWPGIDLSWILDRARWGNGFATEAARAALDWAWRIDRLDHIISLIRPDNPASIRVAQKIGERFERVGVNPINGETVHIYGIRRPGQDEAQI